MRIYEYTDHRLFIRDLIVEHKKAKPDLTHGKVAEAASIKSSFLSQVLGGSQEFSNDQLFAIAQFFELEDEEIDYLILLNEFHRSQVPARKTELMRQIDAIQHLHLRVLEYLDFDRIDTYSSPLDDFLCDTLAPELDAYFYADKFLKQPEVLRKKLGVSEERFAQAIELLIKARIIEPDGQGFKRTIGELFVYKVNAAAKFNAIYSRLKTVEKSFRSDETDLISTMIFCANEEFVQKVKSEILGFQNQMLEKYHNVEPEEVYFMNTDLFIFE